MREFFDAGVAPARGQILAWSRVAARWAKVVWLICLLASLLPSAYAQTTTRGFGNGTNQFTMDFVTIGNPNNVADTTGTPNPVGSVPYTYNLGKYEVSREQIDKANTAGGLGITMSDMSRYGGNGVNKPATGVTWHEAAKFVNWLNTSTGGTAAYKFVSGTLQPWAPTDAGYNANNLFRNSQAKYVIASRDEWYKGAYGSPSGTWYNYPTGSDSRPSAVAGGTDPNTAVYGGQAGPADINNAGGLSAYGTMGQGGNVWEWNETAYDGVYNTAGESLEMRSGSWDIGIDYLDASYRNSYVDPAIDGNNSYGFRVASVDLTALDSDGDGLSDAVETNTGVFVSASGTGTNPNNPDTDGDGISDDVEVNTLNSNPNVSQIPEALLAQQSGPNGFVATWGAVTGAAGYEVQVSTEPSFTSGLIGGDRPVSLGTTTSLGITGISGQIRYYRVRSVLPSQDGPLRTAWSPAVSAPDRSAFGKYATLNATGNADTFQAAVGSSANNSSYTISFWMRPDRLGGVSGSENVQVFRQPINSIASAANVDIDLLPNGSLVFGQKDEAGVEHFVAAPAQSVLAGNWYHVTAVRDAANAALRLYINGVEIAFKTLAFGTNTWNIENSGGPGATQAALNNDSNVNRIRAAFDDVRIYRAVRTPAQILEGMSMPLNKTDANGVANTSLVFYAPLEGTSLSSTDTNSFYKGSLNGIGSGTITSQAVLMTPVLAWTPSPINLVAPAVLSTSELTATAHLTLMGPILPGTWSYSPAAGASLSVGTNAVVGTFVPTDLVTYAIGTITNQIVVTEPSYSVPGVETGPTNSISGLTQTSVKLMGGIMNLGGTTVTNAGFYLNTNSTATNGVKYSAPGTSFGLGSFSNTITGLTPGTSYTYRAFAANSVGTGYGASEYSFTTLASQIPGSLPAPVLTWTPSPINLVAPAVLSTNELTATATAPTGGPVSGSWSYLPVAGASLAVGTNQVVGTFTPVDQSTYSVGTITNQVVVTAAAKENPAVTVTTGSYTYNGSYQGPGVSEVNKGGSTGAVTLQYGGNPFGGAVYGPSSTPPTDAGNYTVVATVGEDANYNQASSSSTAFTIAKATATMTLGSLNQTYNGSPKPVTVTPNPVGVSFTVQYDGGSTPPRNAGDYPVLVTVNDPNYSGSSSGTLRISKATPLLSGITATAITQGQTLSASTITGTAKNAAGADVDGSWSFQNAGDTPAFGTSDQGVTFTPRDTTNYEAVSVAASVTVTAALDFTYQESNGAVTITGYTGTGGVVEIPATINGDPVTSIGGGAFLGKSSITSVTIPDSVTSIGGSAFKDCRNLISMIIPKSVTSLGSFAFSGCDGLTSITLGSSVANIGESTFSGCSSLSSIIIPSSVNSIGKRAFFNCRGLTAITIPSSVITVGEEAFSGCDGLTSVTIGSGVTTIGASAFQNCSGLTSLTIPDNVTSMGASAFLGCSGLTNLTIGSGVTNIATSTFSGCTSLTSVTIPNSVTSLGSFAFSGCTSLTTITIGSGVTSIGIQAFKDCTSLSSVTIGSGVTSIGNQAFRGCTSLASVTFTPTSSVVTIDYGAFRDCTSLTSITIPSGPVVMSTGLFWGCTSLTSVTIPNTVTTIGAQAFRDCTNLTSITIPSSVADINSDAFNGCTNLATVNFELTSPPRIGSNVFTNIKPSAIGYYPVGAALWSGVTINGLPLTPAVSPKLNQTITFNATPVLTWNGLNSKVVLDARVDSGLPLSFVSSNSQVVTMTTDAQVTTVCNLGGSTPSENWAMGLAVDASDNVYVAAQDVTAGNNQFLDKIFKISDGTSVPVVFVGLGNDKPRFLAAHDGYLYVTTSAGVGKVPLTGGSIQYLQLTGTDGSTPHPFTSLSGIAVGAEGNIWVADGDAHAIYKFNSAGVLQQGWAVGWNAPQGLAISPSGDVYVANTLSHEIKKIDPTTGAVTTVAGTGLPGYADGDGTVAQFIYPQGIAFDKEGNLMVVDQQNYRIRKIAFGPSGATVSSLAGGGGSGQASPALDGLGTAAGFNFQIGIGVDSKGNIFSAEGNAKNIRKTRMVGVATIQGAGSATITASQAGNADYAAAAPVTRTVNVVLDPAGDEDGDGLADNVETNTGTYVSATNTGTSPLLADTDGDGVNDGVEVTAGTNPLVKNILRFQTIDMLALGKGNFSIPESNGAGGGTTPAGFRFGTAAYYGGVPFFISDQANQVWHAAKAPGGNGSGPVSVTFPIAVNNVYGFYTLAGLWWGVPGSYVTYTFNFSDGSSYSKGLINNEDLRDYNVSPSFANIINGTTTQNVFVSGNYHLDRQWIDFSAAGHGGKNLVSFTVTDRGASGSSRIFLAAATAQVGAPGQIPPGATDRDEDGILDSYELGLPLSTKPDDADTDDDGLSDGIEVGGATDPLDFDSDNDGLNDGEEVITYGTNPVSADTDGDGAPDGVEVTAGTDPKENSSLPKPVITLEPVSITNTVGGGVTFQVTATNPAGSPTALTYQWYKNETAIPAGTNPNLIILPLTIAEAGNYSVVVSNSYGEVTSSIASLTVNKATPIITVAPTATAIAYGQTLAFSTLSGGEARIGITRSSAGTLIPGTFAFSNTTSVPAAGTSSQNVIFTPTDIGNYNTENVMVNVTVNEALISSGFSHTLYLGAGASTVTAWGINSDGRLGVGDMNSPVNWAKAVQGIPTNVIISSLAAGGTHSLILAGGEVYAAGSDRYGQLGQGGTNRVNRSSFVKVFGSPSNTVIAVSAGGNHSLMVTASGNVFACGDNAYGQLAQPATNAISGTWMEVNFPDRTNAIISVAAGADHNLAVDEGGGVWVWGRNNYGQLGKGTRTAAERIPSKLVGVAARAVAAGFSHSLILETSGTVRGFGRNNCGQTGQSATSNMVLVPTLISGLSGIRLISAGTDSSFAIDGVGQLRSWGYNAYGELLLGYASPSSSPSVYGPTPSLICDNVSVVSGGGYSSLAVGAQGVIFGGRNDVGQAGNGPDPDQVVGDYYYEAGNLALTNLTMDLAGTTETLYDQIFVGNGAATLNGILNLMFVGTYTGPVYGSTQTFDLIWARDGIVLGTGYQLAFNQAGYLVESAVVDKSVEGVSGKVLQATVRAVVNAADLAKAVDLASPSLDGVESVSYGVESNEAMGIRQLSVSPAPAVDMVEMIYSYRRPTGGVMSGAEYFVGGTTYRVEYSPYLNSPWNSAQVTGTTVTPLGGGYERATLRISASGSTGFLRLEMVVPSAK